MKLCAIAVVLSVVLCATQSAPVETEDETSVFLSEFNSSNYDLRSLLERWFNGDIGLRKSLRDLAQMIKGQKSKDEITKDIKDVFGSMSAAGRGLILLLRNVGVHSFMGVINRILGKDAPVNFLL